MIVLRPEGDLHPAQTAGFQAVLVLESLLHIKKKIIPSEKLKKNIFGKTNKEIDAESLCLQNITIVVHSPILHVEEFHNKKVTVPLLYRKE